MENLKLEELDAIICTALRIRSEFKTQKLQFQSKNDNDLRHVVKQQIGLSCEDFASLYPHLFSFMCSTSTTDEQVHEMERAFDLKRQVCRGTISEERAREMLVSGLKGI